MLTGRRHMTEILFLRRNTRGRDSSIGRASAWYADGRGFDPHVRQNILSLRSGHEKILRPLSPFR